MSEKTLSDMEKLLKEFEAEGADYVLTDEEREEAQRALAEHAWDVATKS